ncbi:TetR/AcrR family transcriptional regulator [Burkholderia multivorans]
MLVFAEKGVGASVIQDVIAAAGVSQGTFYNYFRTNQDLLVAVTQELNNELLRLIEAQVREYADPAMRIACGIRMFLHAARTYPLYARFVGATGLHSAGPSSLLYVYLPTHIEQGLSDGRFRRTSVDVALDVIVGTSLAAVLRLTREDLPESQPEQVVAAILRGLGVDHAESEALVGVRIAPVVAAPESLLARVQAKVADRRQARRR